MNYLFIYPHPDDETFFTGGILQRLVKKGDNVVLVILSKGEASTLRSGLSDSADLGQVRVKELNSVCKRLGVTNLIVKDFCDGQFDTSVHEISLYVDELLQDTKPDYVFTFEPFGAYGHPDHVLISEVITKYVSPSKLVYVTIDPMFEFSAGTKNMSKIKDSKPLVPNYIYKLTFNEFLNKLKAMQMYKSQTNSENNLMHMVKAILVMRKEYFAFHDQYKHMPYSVFSYLKPVKD